MTSNMDGAYEQRNLSLKGGKMVGVYVAWPDHPAHHHPPIYYVKDQVGRWWQGFLHDDAARVVFYECYCHRQMHPFRWTIKKAKRRGHALTAGVKSKPNHPYTLFELDEGIIYDAVQRNAWRFVSPRQHLCQTREKYFSALIIISLYKLNLEGDA